MLAACLAGAAEMFLVVFLYLFGNALFELRARTAAPEVMAAALSLLGLAFSHPIGAAVDVAAVPLLLFAVRPSLIANSALNVLLALMFPTVFALGAFAYVSWVFPGSGWSFLAAPAESLAGWAADAARIFPRPAVAQRRHRAGRSAGARRADRAARHPCWCASAARSSRRRWCSPAPSSARPSSPSPPACSATRRRSLPRPPILAAVIVARVPLPAEHRRLVLPLLAAGWFGGLARRRRSSSPRAAVQLRAAFDGSLAEPGAARRAEARRRDRRRPTAC